LSDIILWASVNHIFRSCRSVYLQCWSELFTPW